MYQSKKLNAAASNSYLMNHQHVFFKDIQYTKYYIWVEKNILPYLWHCEVVYLNVLHYFIQQSVCHWLKVSKSVILWMKRASDEYKRRCFGVCIWLIKRCYSSLMLIPDGSGVCVLIHSPGSSLTSGSLYEHQAIRAPGKSLPASGLHCYLQQ